MSVAYKELSTPIKLQGLEYGQNYIGTASMNIVSSVIYTSLYKLRKQQKGSKAHLFYFEWQLNSSVLKPW